MPERADIALCGIASRTARILFHARAREQDSGEQG
jgi:hypothetical protein